MTSYADSKSLVTTGFNGITRTDLHEIFYTAGCVEASIELRSRSALPRERGGDAGSEDVAHGHRGGERVREMGISVMGESLDPAGVDWE